MNYREKISNGLCGACGEKNDSGSLCEKCKQKKKQYRNKLLAEKRCRDCGAANCKETRCDKCKQIQKERRLKLRDNRCCLICGKKLNDNDNKHCEKCDVKLRIKWEKQAKKLTVEIRLRKLAKRIFDDESLWTQLRTKFDEQNQKCAYSGIKIEIGKDAHLDHIVPKSKGGKNTLTNLHWVHKNVNFMKSNLDEKEFLQLVEVIYNQQFGG